MCVYEFFAIADFQSHTFLLRHVAAFCINADRGFFLNETSSLGWISRYRQLLKRLE